MDNQEMIVNKNKSGKGLVIFLIILVILLGTCLGLLLGGVVKNPFVKETKCNVKETSKTKNDTKKDTTTKTNVSESDLEKDTSVTLIKPDCGGPIREAKIVDGNIQVIDGDGQSITIKVGNAKYLKTKAYMSCDNTYLMFITEDGQVYSIRRAHELVDESIRTGKTEYDLYEVNAIDYLSVQKLTNTQDNATAFVKDEKISSPTTDQYGFTSYTAGILEADGSIGTVIYSFVKLP